MLLGRGAAAGQAGAAGVLVLAVEQDRGQRTAHQDRAAVLAVPDRRQRG